MQSLSIAASQAIFQTSKWLQGGPGADHISKGYSETPQHLRWQGKETAFMKSNEHSRDRQGVWDASSLDGPAKSLVEGDEKSPRSAAKSLDFSL